MPVVTRSGARQTAPPTILTRPPVPNEQNDNVQPHPLQITTQAADFPQHPGARHLAYRAPSDIPAPLRILPPSHLTQRASPQLASNARQRASALLPPTAARWPGTGPWSNQSRSNIVVQILARPAQVSPRLPARFFANLQPHPEIPDFTRLDIPNAIGKRIFVDSSGALGVMLNASDATNRRPLNIHPDNALPNSEYNRYPMIIQLLGRPCILYGPLWDQDTSRPLSGDQCFLSPEELQERRVYQALARQDLQRYGSPSWLAQDPGTEG
ncbi:MAG: hypothetical protein Q9225_006303 [Loekoesia sp. 1 TL-2023]